jgi:hypothetical protein
MFTIMIGSSCDSNQQSMRESLIQVTSTSPGVKYSLFIMLLKEIVSMESKGQWGAAPAAYPFLSSRFVDPFGVFHVSPPPHCKINRGVLYIVIFRSGQVCRDQDCNKQMLVAPGGPSMWPASWPAWWDLSLALLRPLLTSSSHDPLIPEKMMLQNDWVHLTSRRSLNVKNMQKQENLLRSSKTK